MTFSSIILFQSQSINEFINLNGSIWSSFLIWPLFMLNYYHILGPIITTVIFVILLQISSNSSTNAIIKRKGKRDFLEGQKKRWKLDKRERERKIRRMNEKSNLRFVLILWKYTIQSSSSFRVFIFVFVLFSSSSRRPLQDPSQSLFQPFNQEKNIHSLKEIFHLPYLSSSQ